MKRQSCYCCGARTVHPAKDAACHRCGKKGALTEVLQEKAAKLGKPNKFGQIQVHGV